MYRIHWRLGWLTSNGMMPCACVSQHTSHAIYRGEKKGLLFLHKTSVRTHKNYYFPKKHWKREKSDDDNNDINISFARRAIYSISLLLYDCRIVRYENMCILVFAAFIFGCDQFLLDFPVLSQINVCTLKFPYLAIDSLIYMQLYIHGLHMNYHLWRHKKFTKFVSFIVVFFFICPETCSLMIFEKKLCRC